jgi:polar amino acid transport system substrate-binding protein
MGQKIKVATVLKDRNSKSGNICHLALLSLLLTGATTGHAETLKVCYDHWAPMTIFPSEASSDRGVVIDMLEKIYTSAGYKLEYYEVPLARGLDMVSEGLCDLLPEYLYTKDLEKGFVFATEETFAYPTAFVIRRDDSWRYSGIESIKGKRIATGPGWDYSSMSVDYQDYIDNPENSDFIEVIAGYDDVVNRVFRMVKEGRVDLYADNELVLQHVLNKMDLNDELIIVHPGLEKKLHERPIFSKQMPLDKRQELIRIWDEGRVSINGKKEKILLDKYHVTLDR